MRVYCAVCTTHCQCSLLHTRRAQILEVRHLFSLVHSLLHLSEIRSPGSLALCWPTNSLGQFPGSRRLLFPLSHLHRGHNEGSLWTDLVHCRSPTELHSLDVIREAVHLFQGGGSRQLLSEVTHVISSFPAVVHTLRHTHWD